MNSINVGNLESRCNSVARRVNNKWISIGEPFDFIDIFSIPRSVSGNDKFPRTNSDDGLNGISLNIERVHPTILTINFESARKRVSPRVKWIFMLKSCHFLAIFQYQRFHLRKMNHRRRGQTSDLNGISMNIEPKSSRTLVARDFYTSIRSSWIK